MLYLITNSPIFCTLRIRHLNFFHLNLSWSPRIQKFTTVIYNTLNIIYLSGAFLHRVTTYSIDILCAQTCIYP